MANLTLCDRCGRTLDKLLHVGFSYALEGPANGMDSNLPTTGSRDLCLPCAREIVNSVYHVQQYGTALRMPTATGGR